MLDANMKLMGRSQEMFSNLSGLKVLDLSGNRPNGSIPTYLLLFKNLFILDLQDNQFSGSLPSIAGKLRLITLDLSSNQLSGYFPQEYDKNDYFFSNNLNYVVNIPTITSKFDVAVEKQELLLLLWPPLHF